MTDTDTSNPLDRFVNSLLQSAGQLMLIVDLADAREVIANEIFLVEPDELANGSCAGRPNRAARRRFR